MATNTQGRTARQLAEQEVHYMRLSFAWNTPNIATGIPFPAYLPAGALVLRTNVIVTTAFNAGTTNTVSIGDNASSFNDMMSGQTVAATGKFESTIGCTSTGLTNTQAGDVRPFLVYAQTGGAATAGAGIAVIEYIPNNDG
jgi:hypothetical protein